MKLVVRDCFDSKFKEEHTLEGIESLAEARKQAVKIMNSWCEPTLKDKPIFRNEDNLVRIMSIIDGTYLDIYGVLIF